jgi:hypothetical protein
MSEGMNYMVHAEGLLDKKSTMKLEARIEARKSLLVIRMNIGHQAI